MAMNIEGGAGKAEIVETKRGVLAHTNHYTHPTLADLEWSSSIAGSVARLQRTQQLLRVRQEPWTVNAVEGLLSDHANAPDSICRHGGGERARTVFWCIADVTAGSIRYGSGPPCMSHPLSHRLP
jgi:isopenicillin-N N-acyltransferase-like protein